MVCGQRPPSPSTTVSRSPPPPPRCSTVVSWRSYSSSRPTGTLIAPPPNQKVLAPLAVACLAAIIPLHHRPSRLGLAVSPSRLVSAISSLLILLHLLLVVMSAPISLAPGGSSSRISARAGLEAATERTRQPIVTGTSVLGIKYKDGVMLAADTLCSYGSMAKYKDARRLTKINDATLLGAGGEYSDFQSITDLLKRNALEDKCTADSLYEEDVNEECAREVWNYLRAVMYNRRNKMNPLWNDLVVAGFSQPAGVGDASADEDKPFLGLVDKIGTTYEDSVIATGFGSYLAIPILREKHREDLEEGEARALLEDCMRVLFYRDCRALNRIQIAKVTKADGVLISEPYEIETSWDSASFVEPKGQLEGDGGW